MNTKNERAQSKKHVKQKIHKQFREEIFQNKANKSKIKYLTDGYIGTEKTNYTNVLNRETTSILFKARTRMLDIKANYRNKYKEDMNCRLCHNAEETQEHILTQCEITRINDLTIHQELLFTNSKPIMQRIVMRIKDIINIIK